MNSKCSPVFNRQGLKSTYKMLNSSICYMECLAISCCPLLFSGPIIKNCTLCKKKHHHILRVQFVRGSTTISTGSWTGRRWPAQWLPWRPDLTPRDLFLRGLSQKGSLHIKTINTWCTGTTNVRKFCRRSSGLLKGKWWSLCLPVCTEWQCMSFKMMQELKQYSIPFRRQPFNIMYWPSSHHYIVVYAINIRFNAKLPFVTLFRDHISDFMTTPNETNSGPS